MLLYIDRFRWDFLDMHPNSFGSFQYLRQHGTFIPHVKPVFPPEDYPVWTSIATGNNDFFKNTKQNELCLMMYTMYNVLNGIYFESFTF